MARGGETTDTFRTKALYLCVRSLKGREGASAFVRGVGAGRIFEDETKPISRELWLRSLVEFDKLVGDNGFRRLSRYMVHPKNLAVWSTLLRGAHTPLDVYRKLDESDAEGGWLFRQRQATSTTWSAELCFLEDDSSADRERIRKALAAELRAIPTLFGLEPAHVTTTFDASDSETPEVIQTATWRSANYLTWRGGALSIVLASGVGVLAARFLGLTGWNQALPALLAAGICSVVTFVVARDVHYRAASRAQHLRILALEREASLRKLQSKEISRPNEEPVLAGKYRLHDQLGYGSAGAVWKAKRLTDGCWVAIKLLRTALAQDPRATDRLRREAQALGLSWHPNVVEVLDEGVLPSGVAFLVTELLLGETLTQRVQRLGPLPPAEVARWGVQATDALIAVHSAGVIHRDVKPDNLFIHRCPTSGEILKLIDFGVAAVSWAETRLTRSGAHVGTAGYAAPEQERGDEVDERADLFALGQTLKQALTGKLPAASESREPQPAAGVSAEWAEVLYRLTAIAPADRYESARAVRAVLRSLLEGDDRTDPRFAQERVAQRLPVGGID
jgi:serine/threonine-protein kinase